MTVPRISHEVTIAAPPQRVFAALTSADDLVCWFSEFADDADDAVFRAWGCFTPGAPDGRGAGFPIIANDPPRVLAFRWDIEDCASIVRFELVAVARGTRLRLTHDDPPPEANCKAGFDDFWILAIGNLRAHVEGRETGGRHDFSRDEHGDVRLDIDIAADAHTVYRALLDPAILDRWIARRAAVDEREGGAYDFGWGGGPRHVISLDPDRELRVAWRHDDQDTVLTWTLGGSGGRTHVTIVHSGWDADRSNADHRLGWQSYVNRLKYLLEAGAEWTPPR